MSYHARLDVHVLDVHNGGVLFVCSAVVANERGLERRQHPESSAGRISGRGPAAGPKYIHVLGKVAAFGVVYKYFPHNPECFQCSDADEGGRSHQKSRCVVASWLRRVAAELFVHVEPKTRCRFLFNE